MNERLLVVEDSPTQAEQLRALLEDLYEVRVARTGEEALQLLAKESYALVISDVVMPGISGYDLIRRIKADPDLTSTPTILVTSLTDPMNIVRGLECGADNYVTKPYDAESLIMRVRRVLDTALLRRRGRISSGVNVAFLGSTFTITSDKEQILDLLLSSVEDVVRSNHALEQSQRQLADAHARLERYASQKDHEARLSNERYRVLMESASDAIMILDRTGTVLEANHRSGEMLGRSIAELCGTRADTFFVEPDREGFRKDLDALTFSGHSPRAERRLRHADGRTVDCEIAASVTPMDGECLVMVIFHDVTERKKAERALRQSEEQMRQAQKLEAIGRLAGGIAHDFNNLLGVIGGNAQLLLHDLEAGTAGPDDLSEILSATERAAGLTHQLLAFSRQQLLETQLVDLNGMVTEVVRMLGRVIGEDIHLIPELDPGIGCIEADPTQVHQVLMNLAVNARDAMPSGGSLRISTDEIELSDAAARMHPHTLKGGSYVRLRVEDSGIGMDEETKRQIFEPFFTTKEAGKGTGLGLATVYGIVKQSGGFVTVDSAPGEGCTFTLCFPCVDADSSDDAPASTSSNSRAGSASVLLVEDELSLRRVIRRMLTHSGYSVLEASTGEEALDLIEAHDGDVDLLLTDIVMPGMNGRELAVRIRERYPNLAVMYMSGHTNERIDRDEILRESAHFIQKPFHPEKLARSVERALSHRR